MVYLSMGYGPTGRGDPNGRPAKGPARCPLTVHRCVTRLDRLIPHTEFGVMEPARPVVTELNERSREVFRHIVEAYVETGEPIGSRTLSRLLSRHLSPATIRNVMADLEDAGLLYAPHTSAGRLPTDAGLRLFVDGLLEVGNISGDQRNELEQRLAGRGQSMEHMLEQATEALSGLSNYAGVVIAPKSDSPLKHIEFVHLHPGRALVVMVSADGIVENRLIEIPADVPASALVEASNYLSSRLSGRTLGETTEQITRELEENQAQLDQLSAKVVEAGLATWGGEAVGRSLIVRGQANLLDDVSAITDLERIRSLFTALETKETMLRVLELADGGEGVQIFIGAANELFNVTGCSMIVAPYQSTQQSLVGAIGVIGPTRMNYARIIPMVDYTAKLIGDAIS